MGVLARATLKGHGLISERRWTPGQYEQWLAHMNGTAHAARQWPTLFWSSG
jgi:hypothetical protein